MPALKKTHSRHRPPSLIFDIPTTSTISLNSSGKSAFPRSVDYSALRHLNLTDVSQSFIFELTDLYEKKNFPKVIYCIHALRYLIHPDIKIMFMMFIFTHSHLLARRGMAERIGNLLGRLQFSDDQLRKTQKGLKDAGVPMPNFGNVGKELDKEINEEPEVEIETEDERN